MMASQPNVSKQINLQDTFLNKVRKENVTHSGLFGQWFPNPWYSCRLLIILLLFWK